MKSRKQLKSIRVYKDDLADLVEVYGSLQRAVDAVCVIAREMKASNHLKEMTKEQQQQVINRVIGGMNLFDAIQIVMNKGE